MCQPVRGCNFGGIGLKGHKLKWKQIGKLSNYTYAQWNHRFYLQFFLVFPARPCTHVSNQLLHFIQAKIPPWSQKEDVQSSFIYSTNTVLNEHSWKEGWRILGELIYLFNKHYGVSTLGQALAEGLGVVVANKAAKSSSLMELTYVFMRTHINKWGNMGSDQWQWLAGRDTGTQQEAYEEQAAEHSKGREQPLQMR